MNPSGHSSTPSQPQRQWYVQVDGQAYGPFDDTALWAFMREGRVTAQSLISQNPALGFRSVSSDVGLMGWLAQLPQNAPISEQAPAQTQSQPEPQGQETVLLVMAEVRSGRGMDVLQTMQGLGQVQRIGDTVWLLRTQQNATQVRDVLSQPLTGDDRLFVLDSATGRPAWFNIGADMDQRIKALWDLNPS